MVFFPLMTLKKKKDKGIRYKNSIEAESYKASGVIMSREDSHQHILYINDCSWLSKSSSTFYLSFLFSFYHQIGKLPKKIQIILCHSTFVLLIYFKIYPYTCFINNFFKGRVGISYIVFFCVFF